MNRFRSFTDHQLREELPPEDTIDELNIRYRICHKYTPKRDKNNENDICICERPKEEHEDYEESNNRWTMNYNTREVINSDLGTLLHGGLYVRLALDTPLEKVEKILLDAWKIRKPLFIVTIIGGAKYFKMNDKLETYFINGIVDIINKSDAWLFSSGYNIGIVQLAGRAIQKFKLTHFKKNNFTAIAVCKWGSIKNVKMITSRDDKKTKQTTTNASSSNKNDKSEERQHGQWDLEMNHSHYLMLDDGSILNYEIGDYRTRLVTHMAGLNNEHEFFVPVVTIAVEGGRDTVNNIYYDLRAKIPVIIVDGTGRAADFFTRWLFLTKDFENDVKNKEIICEIEELVIEDNSLSCSISQDTNLDQKKNSQKTKVSERHINTENKRLSEMFQPNKYSERLKKDVENTFFRKDNSEEESQKIKQKHNENDKNKQINELINRIMYCLQPAIRTRLTVFSLNSDANLTETIFRSICRSRQTIAKMKLYSSNIQVETKQPDIPNDERNIMYETRDYDIRKKEQKIDRIRLLKLAMSWDCIDIAKEFIFQNSLDNILSKKRYFVDALRNNLPTFVYEFLKLGIDPAADIFFSKSEVSKKRSCYAYFIETLYHPNIMNKAKTHLKDFIDSDKSTNNKFISDIEKLNAVLTKLIGDYMRDLYFETEQAEYTNRIKWGLTQNFSKSDQYNNKDTENNQFISIISKQQKNYDYIMRDLFLWAILMNYIDMAKIFLCYMKYRICPALIATKILKQYHSIADYGDLKDRYMENAKYFEKYAIDYFRITVTRFQIKNIIMIGATNRINKDSETSKLRHHGINYCDSILLEDPPNHLKSDLEEFHTVYLRKLRKFHESLAIKCTYHVISYICFLLLFSYVLLFKFSPPSNKIPSIHWTEILTIILVSCMLIEEIHYFFTQDSITNFGKFKSYCRDLFKPLTMIAFILFYIGLILRFGHANSKEDFIAARIVMAIDIAIWWLRCLSFIIVIPFLGPHLVVIGKMLQDLLFFLCIIAIVMIGYGVASRSLVYYPVENGFTTETNGSIDTSFDGRAVFYQVLYPVYYLLYGQFGNELRNLDDNPNAGWSIATHVLLAFHMIFVNVLLANLLIAMFSKRFDEVHDDTKKIWYKQQYLYTREYYARSPFLPPISFFYDIYYLIRMFVFFTRRTCLNQSADSNAITFKIVPNDRSIVKQWYDFEDSSTYEYAYEKVKEWKITLEKSKSELDSGNKVKNIQNDNNSDNKEKKEKKISNDNDSDDILNSLKQLQDDLNKLKLKIEAIPNNTNMTSKNGQEKQRN
ncbi:unnamed protein product [Rotaria sordida]|uniref:Uncharacterized protein n=3 Tax=Rotaria sordida TaxID=392033 RepID=A0A814T125_9BILA|nr:unnamed protein product [Rotaria sordida]